MKKRITEQDYIKANRRASREEEIRAHGKPQGYGRVHKSKKIYDRKKSKAGLKRLPFYLRPVEWRRAFGYTPKRSEAGVTIPEFIYNFTRKLQELPA